MVKKLLHTRYRVHDLEKTVRFYTEVLGLQEVRRHTSGRGSQLVFLKAPESEEEIEICKFDESGPVQVGPDLTHLAFLVDDSMLLAARPRRKAIPFPTGRIVRASGSAIAFIDAPEGYEIELIERPQLVLAFPPPPCAHGIRLAGCPLRPDRPDAQGDRGIVRRSLRPAPPPGYGGRTRRVISTWGAPAEPRFLFRFLVGREKIPGHPLRAT